MLECLSYIWHNAIKALRLLPNTNTDINQILLNLNIIYITIKVL